MSILIDHFTLRNFTARLSFSKNKLNFLLCQMAHQSGVDFYDLIQ